ncbi:hypothetical protein HHI36_015514 [Cryptolaemus montrouzieri]|uniref:Uncharacterized protein n=1 Tax=Cryptolaemus montrouzieri TaxID=559131 RepID=A0ABD2N5Y0_9CUCU
MKDPDFSIKKRAPGSQWADPTDYESSEDEDDEETQDIQEILYELALDETLLEENNENREQYEIPDSDVIWSEYVGRHKNFDFTSLRRLQEDLSPNISPLGAFLFWSTRKSLIS